MRTCLECKHEKPPFTTCYECEIAIMEGVMRSCETCRYQHQCGAAGVHCFKWQGWDLKVEAQLAAKDKIIKGLVDADKAVLAEMCGGCRYDGSAPCEALCGSAGRTNILRAAIAAAKEE